MLPFLKKYFITREKTLNSIFERSISISNSSIIVKDLITYNSNEKVSLFKNETSTFRYVAPSNYFQTNQLLFSNSPIIKHFGENYIISQKINLTNFTIDKSFDN